MAHANDAVSRLGSVEPSEATGRTKELLEAVQAKLGTTPNITKAMAASPAVLEGYLGLSGGLGAGGLDPALRERIALGVAEYNGCGYCLAVHSFVAKNVAKLPDGEIAQSRRFDSGDARVAAGLEFASTVLVNRGGVTDADLDRVRDAGYSDAEIAEIVATVALNVLTNYFNKVADVELDFPPVEAIEQAEAA